MTMLFQQLTFDKKLRKFMKPRSKVWSRFTNIKDLNDGIDKSRCNYYSKEYLYSSKNDTSSLISHLSSYPKKLSDSTQVDPHSQSEINERNVVICKADNSSITKAITYDHFR